MHSKFNSKGSVHSKYIEPLTNDGIVLLKYFRLHKLPLVTETFKYYTEICAFCITIGEWNRPHLSHTANTECYPQMAGIDLTENEGIPLLHRTTDTDLNLVGREESKSI